METGSVVVTVAVVVEEGGDWCVVELNSIGSFSWKHKVHIQELVRLY